jgi:hypothetical protein
MLMAGLPAFAAQPASRPRDAAPSPPEIARALDTVRADPNLSPERTIKTLRWKSKPPAGQTRMPGWLSGILRVFSWIRGLFAWIAESARVLVWCAAALLAGLVAVYVIRIARTRLARAADEMTTVPTHVRDLDIRPQALPDDIGAEARQLWDRGEQRAALALLYRGMLSRLVHVHGVPIRDSSTEGDCLELATARLPPERSEYLSRLVRVWQGYGYGRESVETAAVDRLCDEFTSALRPTSPVVAGLPQETA